MIKDKSNTKPLRLQESLKRLSSEWIKVIKAVGFYFCLSGFVLSLLSSWASAEEPYSTVRPGYSWSFPKDHGSHPQFKTEWWYYVGHLKDPQGKRYGFQLTFFRVGLARGVENPSSFTATDLYLSHFSVSDLSAKKFWFAERMNRPGPGLAGSSSKGLDVWNEDWHAWHEGAGHRLEAEGEPYGIHLKVQSPFPAVLQGIKGYSQKGSAKENASLYYSFPLLTVEGNIRTGAEIKKVEGKAWMDHEFFSGAMDPTEVGWDWFGLQFSDNTELMIYLMREKDGSFHSASSGTWINSRGKALRLKGTDFKTQILETWKSPRTSAVYPIRWEIQIPFLKMKLEVKAEMPDQELDTAQSTKVVYWEGAVQATGTQAEKKIQGEGYLELTGYDHSFQLPHP